MSVILVFPVRPEPAGSFSVRDQPGVLAQTNFSALSMAGTFQIWISVECGHPRASLRVQDNDTMDNVKLRCVICWWLRGRSPRSNFSLHYPAVLNEGLAGTCTIGQLGIRSGGTIIIRADHGIEPEAWMRAELWRVLQAAYRHAEKPTHGLQRQAELCRPSSAGRAERLRSGRPSSAGRNNTSADRGGA